MMCESCSMSAVDEAYGKDIRFEPSDDNFLVMIKNRFPPPVGPEKLFIARLACNLQNRRCRWSQLDLSPEKAIVACIIDLLELQHLGFTRKIIVRAWHESQTRDPFYLLMLPLVYAMSKTITKKRPEIAIDDKVGPGGT
eukprot:5178924-Karenia_brevis.AAC.1